MWAIAATSESLPLTQLPDWVVILIAILPFVGAVIGYVAKPVGEILKAKAAHGLEAERRNAEFQTETLRELQDNMVTLFELARAGRSNSPSDVRAFDVSRAQVTRLMVRVADDEVRRHAGALRQKADDAVKVAPITPEMASALKAAFDATNERLGTVLRANIG